MAGQGAQINRDGNLRLQYLAGLALNFSQENLIYDQLLSYRRFPEGLFAVSPARKPALRSRPGATVRRKVRTSTNGHGYRAQTLVFCSCKLSAVRARPESRRIPAGS